MSSTLTHALSDSILAILFARVHPNETSYILAALASASVVDLDHMAYIIKDRDFYKKSGYSGNLHYARSMFHELVGMLLIGVLSAILFFWDEKLASLVFIAYSLHLIQDWLLGKSHPFIPLSHRKVQFFRLTLKQKAVIDLIILTLSGALWIIYLSGRLSL